MVAQTATVPPFGFNVIGNVSSNTGLGVVARNFVELLVQKGVPVQVLDLDPGLGRASRESSVEKYRVDKPADLSNCVNFFVLQPSAIFSLAASYPETFVATDKLNVGLIMWELATLPRRWSDALAVLDVVAAASEFIGSTFAAFSGRTQTISALCPLNIPALVSPSRRRFGIADEGTLFLTSFEPLSDIRRKNPFAAIEAFRRAFDRSGREQLLIKLNNAKADGALYPAIAELHQVCGSHPNIRIIDETLSYPEVLDLYATCDVFVSMHRAEGLGLALMEAMALGKPVIATAWSGNMTFMDHTNSCLLRYDLIPVDGSLPVYRKEYVGKDAVWADPRIEDAVAWMKRLAVDEFGRKAIGEKAARDMECYRDRANDAHFIDELRAIWQQRMFMPLRDERRTMPIGCLWEAATTRQASIGGRIQKRLARAMEQHFLWRSRS